MNAHDPERPDPKPGAQPPAPAEQAAAPALDPARWIHRLRNELNTASMACAAANAAAASSSRGRNAAGIEADMASR